MKSIESILEKATVEAIHQLFGADVTANNLQFQKTKKEFAGDVTLVVFPLTRYSKLGPEQTAEKLGIALTEVPEVIGFNVVKGFLNLEIADSFWINFLNDTIEQEKFGYAPPKSKDQVMVEYSSPNTNKPLHLGHLRNNFLGYSVSRILEAAGHDVIKVQIVNDRGIHICKSMVAWQLFGNGETPETNGIKGDHLVGKYYVAFDKQYKKEIKELMDSGLSEEEAAAQAPIMLEARTTLLKWEDNDPEVRALWKKMNDWVYEGFDQTYHEMGVEFDQLYYESNTYIKGKDEVMKGLKSNQLFQKDDGSIWCDLTEDGLDEKILIRSDGTTVYMTQDVGTAILRFQDYPNLAQQIYTVGNEQEYHFKVLFLILAKLGFEQAKKNHHLSYGMVELPSGKMKSREGTVVDADELLKEMAATAQSITEELGKLEGVSDADKEELYKMIGYGALKYFLLKVDPKKNMMFDPSESVDFNGNTAPYIQFNYVRTRSILRKAGENAVQKVDTSIQLSPQERAVILKIYDFPSTLLEAANAYNPAILANYSYDLVRDYSSFYQNHPILNEPDEGIKNLRLAISLSMGSVLKNSMGLIGIQMPERM